MPRRVAAIWPVNHTLRYSRNIAEALRTETIGGFVMLGATLVALVWANSPWHDAYESFRHHTLGPSWLSMDVAHWTSSGLLALFFYIAGLELREELTHGELRNPRQAALPVIAAFAGVALPALLFAAVSAGVPGALGGWAIPTATDIAFALAVLAVAFPSCPAPLRAFLLTLAVVDDLIAIAVIALFYTGDLAPLWLPAGIALIVLFGLLQKRGIRSPWVHAPIAVLAWYCVFRSGVHATVAGVALGMLTSPRQTPDDRRTNAEQADHVLRPLSAGICVPLFALTSAGVALNPSALAEVSADRVALGVIVGLVAGKFLGVFGGTWLAVRLGLARLGDGLLWRDLAGVSVLAGVGFTVSLLIGGLAYADQDQVTRVTTAVLVASAISAVLATVIFRIRVRRLKHSGAPAVAADAG